MYGFRFAKCPVSLRKLPCDFRAGHECSRVPFALPQKWQFRFVDFFLSVSNSFRFYTGLVKATCSPLDEMSEGALFCFFAFLFLNPVLTVLVVQLYCFENGS